MRSIFGGDEALSAGSIRSVARKVGNTVRVNAVLASPPSESSAVMEMSVAPARFGAGTRVSERLVVVPLKIKFSSGTSLVFDEAPKRMRSLAGVSVSFTTNGMGVVGTFSRVTWPGIAEIFGKSFTARITAEAKLFGGPGSTSAAVTRVVLVAKPAALNLRVIVEVTEELLETVPRLKTIRSFARA